MRTRRSRPHPSSPAATRRSRRLPVAAALLAAFLAGAGWAEAQPALVYVGAQPGGGNGDDWIQPGEVVSMKVFLYNAGTAAATTISGSLLYLGTDPGVTVTVPTATWPDLLPRSAPLPTHAPHFTLQVGAAVPCGAVLPFRLQVAIGGMDAVSFDIELKLGRKVDHDMTHDPVKRFEEQEATFWGPVSLSRLAQEATMGDINGDGFGDLVMATTTTLLVVYGQARHFVDADMSAPPFGVSTFTGLQPHSLATADINLDGYDDIIAGGHSSLTSAGTVALIYGRPTPWPGTNLSSTSSIAGVARFLGADTFDRFGDEVAAGDVNGDGYDDIVAAALLGDSIGNSRNMAGEAYLIYGRAAPWPDTDLLTPPAGVARFWGADAGDALEQAAMGDVNGDGFDDILLGAWQGDSVGNQRPNAGETYVVYGGPSAWTDTDLALPPPGVARIWGAPFQDGSLWVAESSLTLTATGDFDGDGLDDIVLSSEWGGAAGRPGAWQLYVVFGRTSALGDIDLLSPPSGVVRVLGEMAADGLGLTNTSGIATGDVNGDGYDDLAVAATQEFANPIGEGVVYVLLGGSRRWADVDLRDRSSTMTVFRGVDRNDKLGGSIAAGDVNGDGYDDLLLGAPDADSINDSRPDAGEAYLWYGKPTDTYYNSLPAGSSGPYIDVAGPGAASLPLACDNCFTQIPIGFEFPFYAEKFDTLFVSSNGFLTFAQPSPAFFLPESCMPEMGGANHLIAPFWDDLDPGAAPSGGGVFALVQGTAPYRRLAIEWKDVPHAASSGTGTFEVILFETTGQIHFRYKDLIFGSHFIDNGASAVVGLENGTGAHGVAYSCNDPDLLGGTALVRYVPTTPIFEEHGEQTQALWTPTGHWHDSTNACEPDQHAGERGWYYGNAHLCSYSNGFAGALLAPTVGDFPADARLTFWSRLGTQVGFDLPEVQLSTTGTGGPYATLLSPSDTAMRWRYGGVTNLFANAMDTVDLQFHFSSDSSVSSLGWMVDDIQLVGCDAVGAPAVVQSVAYVPPRLCVGQAALADAAGSYCGDSIDPAAWQWFQDGAAIPGARDESYIIPDTLLPGTYDYSVEITCEGGSSAMSAPAPVMVELPPDPVAPTLTLVLLATRPAPSLLFTWEESAGAEDYVVLQDTIANGSFTTILGTAPAGETSLGVPIPPGGLLYFLVAGRNLACGLGPTH